MVIIAIMHYLQWYNAIDINSYVYLIHLGVKDCSSQRLTRSVVRAIYHPRQKSTNTSGHKRKSSFEHASDNASGSKRRRSLSQKSKLAKELDHQLSIGLACTRLARTCGIHSVDNRIYS